MCADKLHTGDEEKLPNSCPELPAVARLQQGTVITEISANDSHHVHTFHSVNPRVQCGSICYVYTLINSAVSINLTVYCVSALSGMWRPLYCETVKPT